MTAGLIAAHDIWFGPCHGPNEINKKGFFESVFVKRCIKNSDFINFGRRWIEWTEQNGCEGIWGVKTGPKYYRHFKEFNPVVVCTSRPVDGILRSRKEAGFYGSEGAMKRANHAMSKLPACITVETHKVASGDYSSLLPVFDGIGLDFDKSIADEWVDPTLWGGNG